MKKKLLIQLMIVLGCCGWCWAQEKQGWDSGIFGEVNGMYDRLLKEGDSGDQLERVEKEVAGRIREAGKDEKKILGLGRCDGLSRLGRYALERRDTLLGQKIERMLAGIDLDKPELELLEDSEIIRLINSFLSFKEPNADLSDHIAWVLYNIGSERVRECYIMLGVAEKLDKGSRSFVDNVFTDMDLCSVSEKVKNNVRELVDLYEPLQQGKEAPDCEFESMDGKKMRLSDLRGKMLFLEVWNLDSESCREDLARLEKLKAGHKNIQFVTIAVEPLARKDAWRQFLKTNGYDGKGIHLFADEKSAFKKNYCIRAVPRCMVIDSEGKFLNPWSLSPGHEYFSYFFSLLMKQ